jgi:putative intracellular protease/amidase
MTSMTNGRIAVAIEEHFDGEAYRRMNEFLPSRGFAVEYASHLWGQPALHFGSRPEDGRVVEHVTVEKEIADLPLEAYDALVLIGGYAMDRLRYQANPRKGAPNQAPAVETLRRAMAAPHLYVGAMEHSLWLACADRRLLEGKRVTCAHSIICDVRNAGATVVYAGDRTADVVVDGRLVTGGEMSALDRFLETLVGYIERRAVGDETGTAVPLPTVSE